MTLEDAKVLASAALLPELLEIAWRRSKLRVSAKTQRLVGFGTTMAVLVWWQGIRDMLSGLGFMACVAAMLAVFAVRPYDPAAPPAAPSQPEPALPEDTEALEEYAEEMAEGDTADGMTHVT